MGVPRRQSIGQVAKEIGLENPGSITYAELHEKIDALPEPNWSGFTRKELKDRLANELNGARPYA